MFRLLKPTNKETKPMDLMILQTIRSAVQKQFGYKAYLAMDIVVCYVIGSDELIKESTNRFIDWVNNKV